MINPRVYVLCKMPYACDGIQPDAKGYITQAQFNARPWAFGVISGKPETDVERRPRGELPERPTPPPITIAENAMVKTRAPIEAPPAPQPEEAPYAAPEAPPAPQPEEAPDAAPAPQPEEAPKRGPGRPPAPPEVKAAREAAKAAEKAARAAKRAPRESREAPRSPGESPDATRACVLTAPREPSTDHPTGPLETPAPPPEAPPLESTERKA